MKTFRLMFVFGVLVFLQARSAAAQTECSGYATRKSFDKEVNALAQEYQTSIIEYRKLEKQLETAKEGSPEGSAVRTRIAEIKAKSDQQKKKIDEFNSPYFPSTDITALGAACRDTRWMEIAKEKLMERPELLGRRFFVWMEKGSRKFRAAEKRPHYDNVQS